jgi:hypothetical protein
MAKNKPNRLLNQSLNKGCARLQYTTFDNISQPVPFRLKGECKPGRRSDRPNIRCGGSRNSDDGANNDDANGGGASNVRLLERFERWQKPYLKKRGLV